MKHTLRLPDSCRRWIWRYRLRLQVLSLLSGILLFISAIDFLFDQVLFQLPMFQQGTWKITEGHFRSPEHNLWHGNNWINFLNRAIEGKPGWFGEKWFYILLLILYLWLAAVLFCRLTPPDSSPPPTLSDETTTNLILKKPVEAEKEE